MTNPSKLFTAILVVSMFICSSFSPRLMADPQTKDKPDDAGKVEKAKKPRPYPFHGKLGAVDKTAKSITIHGAEKSRTFYLTEKTKIQKLGKPATLADAVVGEEVAGSVLPDENGKLMLNSLRIGPKPETEKKAAKPKKDTEKES